MSFAQYLKMAFWDYLFVLVGAWALEQTCFDVFFVPAQLQYGPIPFVVSAVLLAIGFAAGYRRNTLLVLGALYALLVVGFMVLAVRMSATADFLSDVEGNWFWGALVIVASTTAGLLLTRTLVGSLLWFAFSVFLCAAVQFFYPQHYEFGYFIAVLLSSLAMIVYRNGMIGLYKATAARKLNAAALFASSALPALGALGVAALVWVALIAPLNPQVLDLKLIVDYRNVQILEYRGVGTVDMAPNTDMKTQNLEDDGKIYTTDDLLVDQDADRRVPANAESVQRASQHSKGSDEKKSNATGRKQTPDLENPDPPFDIFTYELPPLFIWILIGIAVVLMLGIAGYFVGRRALRKRRLARILRQAPAQQVRELFLFLMDRLGKIGFAVPEGVTLTEYASRSAAHMEAITAETGVALPAITQVYVRTAYGSAAPEDDDVESLVAFYRGFWKGARRHLGNIGYFFKSFKL